MIGWMRGVLREKRPPHLLVEVSGIGYELEAPMTTFYKLPDTGKEVTLFTHHLVREDAQQLFAFSTENERNVFRMLLRVNGVGAKLALAILSGMDAAAFARCVYEGDTDSLSRLPGIGRKTAERLVIEMRDRLDKAPGMSSMHLPRAAGAPPPGGDPVAEAVHALVALGFKPPDAARRVQAVPSEGLRCEEIVRRALQAVAR